MRSPFKYLTAALVTQLLATPAMGLAEEKAPPAKTKETSPVVVDAAREQAALLEYVAALEMISRGDEDEGRAALTEVVAKYPGTFTESRARDILARLDENDHHPRSASSADIAESGRAELIASQTLIGAYLGVLFPLMMGAEDGGPIAAGALMGAGAGLAASTFGSASAEVEVSQAQALALYMGELWGGTNALLLAGAAEVLEGARPFAVSQFVGMGLGGAASLSLQKKLDLSVGQVNLAYSTCLWSSGLAEVMLVTILGGGPNVDRAYFLTPVVVGNAALAVVGSQVANVPISRSRVRLVNLGGTLGALVVTAGLTIRGWDEIDSVPGLTIPYIAGVVSGLAVGWQVTDGWDERYHPEIFAKSPTTSLLAVEEGHLRLGDPVPVVTFDVKQGVDGERTLTPVAQLSLISGTW